MTKLQTFNRVKQIIYSHGSQMTAEQLDRAVNLWGLLVMPAVGQVARLVKSVPTIDTRKQDAAWRARCRREDSDNGKPKDQPNDKPEQKLDNNKDRRVDIGKNKDHKPVSLNKWKVRLPSGRTMLYQVNENGSISHKWTDDYIPTYREVPELHHDHVAEMHKHIEDDKKEGKNMDKESIKKSLTELDRIESINLGSLGHQSAAIKCGCNLDRLPAGTDLTKMDISAMRQLARQQTREAVAHISRLHSRCYRG